MLSKLLLSWLVTSQVTDYELIPGGCNIRVTEENKHEYVDRVAEHRLTTAIRPQITAFLEGFNELVAHELISIFNDKEMELLISGLPEIDLEDLKANTEYTGYTAASPIVQWFWDVVGTFNKEDMARLLQFITGTSKVGFATHFSLLWCTVTVCGTRSLRY
jgi:E3 ubiquitin-protein ligase HUWE1